MPTIHHIVLFNLWSKSSVTFFWSSYLWCRDFFSNFLATFFGQKPEDYSKLTIASSVEITRWDERTHNRNYLGTLFLVFLTHFNTDIYFFQNILVKQLLKMYPEKWWNNNILSGSKKISYSSLFRKKYSSGIIKQQCTNFLINYITSDIREFHFGEELWSYD